MIKLGDMILCFPSALICKTAFTSLSLSLALKKICVMGFVLCLVGEFDGWLFWQFSGFGEVLLLCQMFLILLL